MVYTTIVIDVHFPVYLSGGVQLIVSLQSDWFEIRRVIHLVQCVCLSQSWHRRVLIVKLTFNHTNSH